MEVGGNEQAAENTQQIGERTFTQDEVNRIVQERLAKERNRSGQIVAEDEKVRDLERREKRLICAERLSEKGLPKDLLDVLDTSDADKFMENIGKLAEMNFHPGRIIPRVVSSTPGPGRFDTEDDTLRGAFHLEQKGK